MDEKLLNDAIDYLNEIEGENNYVEIRSKIHECRSLLNQIKQYKPKRSEEITVDDNIFEFEEKETHVILKKYVGFDDEKIVMPSYYNNKPITEIGERAFENCIEIGEIILGDEVSYIGEYAFSGCKMLTSVTSKNVEEIDDYAFQDCAEGECFEFYDENNRLESVGDYAFWGTGVENIAYINLFWIGDYAFSGCELTSLLLSERLRHIGDYAFAGNYIEDEIIIPQKVNWIGQGAFEDYCSGTIKIYSKDTYIGDDAFDNEDEDILIFCYLGSTAQEYCRKNKIKHRKLT